MTFSALVDQVAVLSVEAFVRGVIEFAWLWCGLYVHVGKFW